ncbi:MAG TPA: hypothetical protein VF975_05170 [Thermoanaerobaculia bacterium]
MRTRIISLGDWLLILPATVLSSAAAMRQLGGRNAAVLLRWTRGPISPAIAD